MIKKLLLIFFTVLVIHPLVSKAADATEIKKQQDALLRTAEAYWAKNKKDDNILRVHYDSYRKQLYATPEDATKQHIVYTVCSGITFQSYYQTLGITIPPVTEQLLDFASDNKDSEYRDYVIVYYTKPIIDALGSTVEEQKSKILEEVIPKIQTGDILVYTGHAMLIHTVNADDAIVFEAGIGAKYKANEHVDVVDTASTLRQSTVSNYINYFFNKVLDDDAELAIVRPTKNGDTYLKQTGSKAPYTYEEVRYSGITAAAQTRLDYPNIEIEKLIDIKDGTNQNLTAGLNEEIEYTITISNNSEQDYNNLTLTEIVPEFLEIKDAGTGTINESNIIWNITTIPKNEHLEIKYTVKVPNDASLLGKTFVSEGDLSNIKTTRIETIIGTKVNSDNINKLRLAYEELKNNDSTEREFINEIYQRALNINLGISNLSNTDILEYDVSVKSTGLDTLAVKRTKIKNETIGKYIYHNFYGPRVFEGVNTSVNSSRDCPSSNLVRIMLHWNIYVENELNDRARNIFPSMLLDGDIILLYTNNEATPYITTSCPTETLENESYIYLNNKLIRKKADKTIEEISGAELDKFLNDIVGENYILLRPSNEELKFINNNFDEEYVEIPDTLKTSTLSIIGIFLIICGISIYLLIPKKDISIENV